MSNDIQKYGRRMVSVQLRVLDVGGFKIMVKSKLVNTAMRQFFFIVAVFRLLNHWALVLQYTIMVSSTPNWKTYPSLTKCGLPINPLLQISWQQSFKRQGDRSEPCDTPLRMWKIFFRRGIFNSDPDFNDSAQERESVPVGECKRRWASC